MKVTKGEDAKRKKREDGRGMIDAIIEIGSNWLKLIEIGRN